MAEIAEQNAWFFPSGALAGDGWDVVADSGIPGWRHTGIRVGALTGGGLRVTAGDVERVIVPLAGPVRVACSGADDQVYELRGRPSVFDGPTDVCYLGVGTAAELTGDGRVAVCEAPASRPHASRRIAAEDVPVELRGAGRSSRQVHNFGTPDVLDADKIIVCEVVTPAENWSSYPPHKHDTDVPGRESRLEEIYYFEVAPARDAEAPASADPFALFSVYDSPAGRIRTDARVRSGDVALVPYGYHGPAAAAPGYDLYYLNVMAGPDPERVWNITDDPAHGWVRGAWDGQEVDPRLPYTRRGKESS